MENCVSFVLSPLIDNGAGYFSFASEHRRQVSHTPNLLECIADFRHPVFPQECLVLVLALDLDLDLDPALLEVVLEQGE